VESVLNGLSFSLLLTSLFVLRFRGWNRPVAVGFYFMFFLVLEVSASRYFMPPGAFGSGLSIVCFGLTVPVLVAAYLVWRHEKRQGESE
jgi:hypothetical protein